MIFIVNVFDRGWLLGTVGTHDYLKLQGKNMWGVTNFTFEKSSIRKVDMGIAYNYLLVSTCSKSDRYVEVL